MYLLTLLSPMSIPSLSSSPWMRGAPQPGFSRHIWRIRARISWEIEGRPTWPCRTFQARNWRKPARCQATTVSGLTMARAERQLRQMRDNQTQNRRSAGANFGRFLAERRSRRFGGAELSSLAQAARENGTSKAEYHAVS